MLHVDIIYLAFWGQMYATIIFIHNICTCIKSILELCISFVLYITVILFARIKYPIFASGLVLH